MILQKLIKKLRNYRVYHRLLGLGLSVFLLISAVTGLLLGWKKNVDLIQPPTQKGVSKDLSTWMPVADLAVIAESAFRERVPGQENNGIDRMDVRPGKGIVKVLFDNGWWEVQVDGTSGEVLSVARRHSDWIEALHDGSIVTDWFKLGMMNILGLGLVIMIVTGLWLWYGPKVVRRVKRRQ